VPSNWRTVKGNTYYGYPVPENLRYTNTALLTGGSDGKPLGDLNWFPEQITSVTKAPAGVPASFDLSQNYPNPFNPSTKIDFTIPSSSQVVLKVFNVLGQEVASLVNGTMTAGSHTVTFDASKLASGVYLYKITAGSFVSTRKMVLLK